jgi:hypothetical protein
MCDPVTIALTAAQSALQIGAAQEAQDRQEAYFFQNRANAISARDLKVRQENLKLSQEQDNLVEENIQQKIEAMNTKARQIVSAGEAGVAGGVLETLVMDTEATAMRNRDANRKETKGLVAQSTVNRQGFDADMQNNINSVKRGEPVNALGIIAGNALMSAGGYYTAKGNLGIFSGA